MTGSYTGGALREPGFESIESMTQSEFADWALRHEADGGGRVELLNGRIVMTPPAGHPHGGVELRIATMLGNHVERTRAGIAFGSSQGFALPSGDTVEPDLSFVSTERWSATLAEEGRFLRVVPDLVIEILSQATRARDRGEKKAIYEHNGVREYWLVDSRARQVTRFHRTNERWDLGAVFEHDDAVASIVLPGLVVELRALFTF